MIGLDSDNFSYSILDLIWIYNSYPNGFCLIIA